MLFEKINNNMIRINGSSIVDIFIDKIYSIEYKKGRIHIYALGGNTNIDNCTTDNFNELENILISCNNNHIEPACNVI